jgi:hypothetical protein
VARDVSGSRAVQGGTVTVPLADNAWWSLAEDVTWFLGAEGAGRDFTQAIPHVEAAVAYVRSYTRGVGFEDAPDLPDDLAAVIVSVAARSVLNPGNYRSEMRSIEGDYTRSRTWDGPPIGFTLVEHAVLARYRQRTA